MFEVSGLGLFQTSAQEKKAMRQDNRPRRTPYAGAAVFLIFGFAFAGMTHHAPENRAADIPPPVETQPQTPAIWETDPMAGGVLEPVSEEEKRNRLTKTSKPPRVTAGRRYTPPSA